MERAPDLHALDVHGKWSGPFMKDFSATTFGVFYTACGGLREDDLDSSRSVVCCVSIFVRNC